MASYSTNKIQTVEEIIDKFTQDTLDVYARATVKNAAKSKMKEGASAIDVADAVFDCLNKNFSGTSTEAVICHQICPKTVLCILRNEIIKKLK